MTSFFLGWVCRLKKAALLAHAKAEKTVEKQLDKKYTLLYKEEKDKVKDMKKELGRMTQLVSDFRQKMCKVKMFAQALEAVLRFHSAHSILSVR